MDPPHRIRTPCRTASIEAKLNSIKKKNDRTPNFNGTLAAHHTEQLDPDAEEIQSGQEEADEGLWLLWKNKRPDSAPQGQGRDYTSSSVPFTTTTTTTDALDIRSSSDEEDIEDRLEQAKARAKHAEDYARSDRNCCCIIS
ncbi:hypothetical protein MVEG_03916 [Podila verticillata NRRL 6337]|nr:hypothetical protein MVEG_03916 [Podila verticillata NRRL 6337]